MDEPDDPGETVNEIAEKLKCSREAARSRIMHGVREGRFIAGRAVREASDGKRMEMNVYRLADTGD